MQVGFFANETRKRHTPHHLVLQRLTLRIREKVTESDLGVRAVYPQRETFTQVWSCPKDPVLKAWRCNDTRYILTYQHTLPLFFPQSPEQII